MKKIIVFMAGLFIIGSLAGCSVIERQAKDVQSQWTGLDRIVTVYDMNGKPIKTYEGKIDIEDTSSQTGNGGSKVKFELNGKRIIIYNSPVIVEEK
jgi:hypothetical protein